MATFRLKAGLHVGPDYSQEPNENGKYPSKTYAPGQTVESDDDLVAKHGAEKFEYVHDGGSRKRAAHRPGDVPAQTLTTNPAVFPQGQVSTGHQSSTVTEDGRTVAGPLPPDHPLNRPFDEGQGEPAGDDGLEGMTKADLQAVAESEGVEVRHGATKNELVNAIRDHRAG